MTLPLGLSSRLLYARVHSGVQFRLRHLLGGRFADRCQPASIAILLTELCTARCVHCDIWKNNTREDSPTPEVWKKLLTDLRRWLGPVRVVFTGGEALMKPFTPEVVAHAVDVGLITEVLTHGYWEDQGKIERLAKARPWMVTVSLDGIGEAHTRVRGRVKFWERTSRSLETLQRLQQETGYPVVIRLKHVIMSHNLDEPLKVADYANREGMEVMFQPIEQNYNTPDDPDWFVDSENWVRDTDRVIGILEELKRRKTLGWRIANQMTDFDTMADYFRNPAANRVAVQGHVANERRLSCTALTLLQIQANGDVRMCSGLQPVGNIKHAPIRDIWQNRPRVWISGCCLEHRLEAEERQKWIPASELTKSAISAKQ